MATNLQLDDSLINEALTLGNHRTKKDAVTQALSEYVLNLKQKKILALFGEIDYTPGHDYKSQRNKK